MTLEKFDDENFSLYFKCGICNLFEFSNLRMKKKIYWFERQEDLLYIIKELFMGITQLVQFGIFHGDLKP